MNEKTTTQAQHLKAICAKPTTVNALNSAERSAELIMTTFVDHYIDSNEAQFDTPTCYDQILVLQNSVPWFSIGEWLYLFVVISEASPRLDQPLKRAILNLQKKNGKEYDAVLSQVHFELPAQCSCACYLIARKYALDGIHTVKRLRQLIGTFARIDSKCVFSTDMKIDGYSRSETSRNR